jgi:hypothetical protein
LQTPCDARHPAPVEPATHDQSMRSIVITIGVCLLVGGISVAVRQALQTQQNGYLPTPETSVLWYALGGPTPDRVAWIGADTTLEWFLSLPLDIVLMTAGGVVALVGLASRNRH